MGDEIRKVTELIIRERKNAEIKYPPPIISYAQNGEDILLNRAFMGKKNGFYIDVGAGKPSDDSVTKVFYDLGWRGINIEPNPCNFVLLEEERMEDTNLPFGIASKPETKTFYILKTDNSWGKSSFDKQCIKGLPDDLYDKKEVETKQLSDVISEYSSNKVIDFLKVDVEGSEYDVLKTLNFDINRPRVIILESVHPGTTKPVGDSCRKLV